MRMCNQQVEISNQQKLDWVVLPVITTDIAIYTNHSITKQQYEQALAAKLEAESQVRVATATKSNYFSKISDYSSNRKLQTNKQKWLLPILKEQKHCLMLQN